jgi:hypothetical protein
VPSEGARQCVRNGSLGEMDRTRDRSCLMLMLQPETSHRISGRFYRLPLTSGCATWKWKSGGPAVLPVILEATAEIATS